MNHQGAIARKDRLTLTQLAGYDDILTDALVDHVCVQTSPRNLLLIRSDRSTSGQPFAKIDPSTTLRAVSIKTILRMFYCIISLLRRICRKPSHLYWSFPGSANTTITSRATERRSISRSICENISTFGTRTVPLKFLQPIDTPL